MDMREFSTWVAFFERAPFGPEIDSLGHAITASVIANVNRGRGHAAYRPDQFMPGKRDRPRQSVAQMRAEFQRAMRAWNG